ncbi:M3 family metallopeptidase [Gallaecimonas sp. GXIMD4217]|uniref:M3 family metallopeptidase n=1 Tax=Gallaecimonas sp. GXIMD4217 TaxID=3131927 RepID=UPI00311B0263
MRWTSLAWLLALSLNPWPAEAGIQDKCEAAASALAEFPALPQAPRAWLKGLDAWRLPARNTLNEAYVLADLSPDAAERRAARQCIQRLGQAFDTVRPRIRREARQRLAGARGLEKRALSLWAGGTGTPDGPAYRQAKAEARRLSRQFRHTIDKAEPKAVLPLACAGNLKDNWRRQDGWHIPLPAPTATYHRLASDHCRQSLFVASESRLEKENGPVLTQLLAQRQQMAELKGKSNYAELRLAGGQLNSPDAVWAFLDRLSADNRERAETQWQAAGQPPLWAPPRVTFQHRFRYRPERVIDGWLDHLSDELGLRFVATAKAAWHPDVLHYEVFRDGRLLGELYLDLYRRDGKYGHNRHRELRRGVTGVQTPASVLALSLPRKRWGVKHLKSLLHESGHALNNLLASQPYQILAGIRLPSELVEVPAKVLERLAWDPAAHHRITGQRRTPEPDPRQYGVALDERILKAALALAYHEGAPDRSAMDTINRRLYRAYLRRPLLDGMAPQYSFRHLASYGPNYVSYLHADHLAERLGARLANNSLSLRGFSHCLLSAGGSRPGRDQLACALGETP